MNIKGVNTMSQNGQIKDILETTMNKIRELVTSETVVGDPIIISPQLTLIPISRMSFGFASGGSDFSGKTAGNIHFGGGSGAGVTVLPLGFLSISGDNEVKYIPVESGEPSAVEGVISSIPETIAKFKEVFAKKKPAEDAEPKTE